MQGSAEDISTVADLRDPACVHHRQPISYLPDEREIVGDVQNRGALAFLQFRQQIEDSSLNGHVKGSRRFIRDEQIRITRKRLGNHDALFHSAGELVRVGRHHFSWIRYARVGKRLQYPFVQSFGETFSR
jgi:hypothetical protein